MSEDRDDWLQHPMTRRLMQTATQARISAFYGLVGAARNSADPIVRAAWVAFELTDSTVADLGGRPVKEMFPTR